MSQELDVSYVARLARLRLTSEEAQLFQEQLAHVLEHVDKMSEVDVSGVEASAHAVPVFDVFRVDEIRPGLSAEEAWSNAPRQANGLFVVPKVME
jgi:aspartyl-tRNA(Asn)/glutamyl-tRNA(Gln) amidotransferase subunit C